MILSMILGHGFLVKSGEHEVLVDFYHGCVEYHMCVGDVSLLTTRLYISFENSICQHELHSLCCGSSV